MKRKTASGRTRVGLVALLAAGAAACSDGSIGLVGSGPTERVEVEVDGPLSSLGSWRYYDGVRLLECDVRITARAIGGSSGSAAEWVDGVVDLYDLRSGRYLGSDYMYFREVADLWGAEQIETGEQRVARSLRYTSYAPFRAYFLFRYTVGNVTRDAEHRFDCR